MTKKKICLITPGHLASNPRLVKEASLFSRSGMSVHVIFTQYTAYLGAHDQRILDTNPTWTFDRLDWKKSTLLGKLNRGISGIRQKISNWPELTLNRNFNWQLKKAIGSNADLFIGHNLGALPVAVLAAERLKVRSGFDAEDIYRYQLTDDDNDIRVITAASIEEKYIPRLSYLTGAGEPISEWYRQKFNRPVTSILNVSPKTPSTLFRTGEQMQLRILWFSQTIGPNRGLEAAIEAIGLSQVPVELHLLGEISTSYRLILEEIMELNAPGNALIFNKTLHPDDIFYFCSQFEIGLASEPGFSENNRRAISNKIFTYIQSGLYVAASATPAQESFIREYPDAGVLYRDSAGLADILKSWYKDREHLLDLRKRSFMLGQHNLNWEHESEQFLALVKSTINE